MDRLRSGAGFTVERMLLERCFQPSLIRTLISSGDNPVVRSDRRDRFYTRNKADRTALLSHVNPSKRDSYEAVSQLDRKDIEERHQAAARVLDYKK